VAYLDKGEAVANSEQGKLSTVEDRTVSRREFLKLAGIAGATVGVGTGLGGLISACGSTEATTTTGAGSETTATSGASSTTSTSAASQTTVSAAAETGEELRIGFVSPTTGPLANFGIPDKYAIERCNEYIGDGIVCGDGKKHPVKVILQDTQSDSNRASQVAGDLIMNEKIHVMMAASTPDTVTPAVEQCEANGVPVVSTDCPWQTYLASHFDTGYKWSYHVSHGAEDMNTSVVDTVTSVQTNKVCGFHMSNNADGSFYYDVMPPHMKASGLTVVDGGLYDPGAEDYTSIISLYKKNGCEIVISLMSSPDFTNFWKACKQQAFNPKVVFVAKAVMFPQAADSLGEIGNGLLCDAWWDPKFPFKSSLTGETCEELAADFEKRTSMQASNPLMHYVVTEMAMYALQHAKDPTNRESILAALETMKLDTSVAGPIDFTAEILKPTGTGKADYPAGPGRKKKNVWDQGRADGQWLMLGGKWKFTKVLVNNIAAPFLSKDMLQPVKTLPITSA
jgi:branched-chain amino acid transport system substrate-binding protein